MPRQGPRAAALSHLRARCYDRHCELRSLPRSGYRCVRRERRAACGGVRGADGDRARRPDRSERPLLLEQDPSPARWRRRSRRLHVRAGARLGAPRRRLRPAARRAPGAFERELRGGRLRRASARLQPLERALRRAARRGPLLEIPVNCESYNLAYVPAVLDAAGLEVPTTWTGYFAAARTVVERTGGRVARLRAAGHRRVAHDVHGLRHAVLVVRRLRLRSRPLRARVARIAPGDLGLPRGAAGVRPAELARAALVRARARLRPGPVRADRRLGSLRRVLRGSGVFEARRRDRLRAAARAARPACAGRTCGPGRSS